MADTMDYLSPDFDLNSLTVPRLRAILVNHDVPYPASAKKSQLIRILEDEVLPQAKKLIRDRERVKRTSDGITDMGSRATSVASSFDGYQDYHEGAERDSMPPPPTPSSVSTAGARRARSTRSSRAPTADLDEQGIPATLATASRRSVARSQSRPSRRIDEGAATPVARKDMATPRQSTVKKLWRNEMTPSTEPELPPSRPSIKPEPVERSVFTDDNPFQSGSSPASWEQQKLRSARKSYSRVSESPVKSGLRARKSETPIKQEDESFASAGSSFRFLGPSLEPYQGEPEERGYNDEENDYDAGEEFTPEEQLALEYEQADRLYAAPARSNRRARKQSKASKAAPWVVILSLLSGFAGWWRKEKVEIGFCGIGKPTWSLAETKVPEWANVLEPQCEPCPPHAFCYPNFEARCEHDFILTPHPLSLGGLVPLSPTCEPDSEKARRVKAVADKAVEELRDRRAKWECGELSADGKEAKSPEISEHDLKREIGNKRRKGMSDTEFDDLWLGALGEVIGKEEVVAKTQQ